MSVSCECCVLLGRGLCDELITRPEKSCRLWCIVMCDLETSGIRRPWAALGRSATKKKQVLCCSNFIFDDLMNRYLLCTSDLTGGKNQSVLPNKLHCYTRTEAC
jgi:hypothetical protein